MKLLLDENLSPLQAQILRAGGHDATSVIEMGLYPSLHLKKIGRFWSVRVGLHYRALAVEDRHDLVWFWIGPHAEYNSLVKG